tara:strand:- start:61 stop:435 length:375 start_codon:yes stop_codon:yes gene_type:complete
MITLMQVIQELRPGAQCRIIGDTYNDIIWDDEKQRIPTEGEINEKLKELQAGLVYKLLREERNKRLAECDWIVTKNAEYGYNISKEWRNYRQALRDLPSITYKPELDNFGNLKMDSVAWPTPPE